MRRALPWVLLLALLGGGAYLWKTMSRTEPASSPSGQPSAAPSARPPAPSRSSTLQRHDVTPEAKAGERFTVELMDPPERSYGATPEVAADRTYAAIIAKLGRPGVVYDPALGRAARELALQQSLLDGLVPQDAVDFILRSAGAVDRTVEQAYAEMSDESAAAVERRVVELLDASPERGRARVGIGEAWIPGAKRSRVVGMILSRRDFEIDPAPRRVEPGSTWTVTGTLPPGFGSPSALVLRPGGVLEAVPVTTSGSRFTVSVPAGDRTGTIDVSMGANGPAGHASIWQVPVEVGRDPPQTYETRLPPDESTIKTVPDAEALAFELLNADRRRFGLPPVARDAALDVVARAHSVDMRDHGFFAHRSPTTGEPGDRLTAAKYKFRSYGENIALESSLHAAEMALLASLGHRKNILGDFTRVGIGIARGERHGRMEWHLTQLFSTPAEVVDARAAERMSARIEALRKSKGLAPLAWDAAVARIAERHARDVARGDVRGIGDRALADLSREGLARGGARAWALQTGGLDDAELPDVVTETGYERFGVGVFQSPDDPRGAIGVVLLMAADPK